MLMLELAIAALVGGVTFWLRASSVFESLTGRGKTTADAVWALFMAALAALANAEWYGALAVGIGMWLSARPGWWQSLSLGRNAADGAEGLQYLRHAARGMVWVAGGALGAWLGGLSPLPLLIAGTLCVPCYVIGYAWREGHADPYTNPTAIGEFLFGAAIGVGVVLGGYTTWGLTTWPL